MISGHFDERTMANMELALSRACAELPASMQGHEIRKLIAGQIISRAEQGHTSLSELTAAAKRALGELLAQAS